MRYRDAGHDLQFYSKHLSRVWSRWVTHSQYCDYVIGLISSMQHIIVTPARFQNLTATTGLNLYQRVCVLKFVFAFISQRYILI